MTSFLGCEKLTAKWFRFFVSLPVPSGQYLRSALLCDRCIPRGPVTVTSLDLMTTLTIAKPDQQLLLFCCGFLQRCDAPVATLLSQPAAVQGVGKKSQHLPPSGTVNCSLEWMYFILTYLSWFVVVRRIQGRNFVPIQRLPLVCAWPTFPRLI